MQEFLVNFPYVNVIIILLAATLFKSSFKRIMQHVEKKANTALIEKFDHVHAILAFHMDASYETIHKDNILVYSLDGVKPKEEDIDNLTKEFVKLTMKLAGPNMLGLFEDLYGDDETLFFVMMDYFTRRFEDDEIRASAIDNIQDGGDI
jgi:hypothetical protein